MNIFYNMGVKKWEKRFEQQLGVIRAVLLKDLEVEYKILTIRGDSGQQLAKQVVNYLLGADIETKTLNPEDTVFTANFSKLKDKVKQYAEHKMNRDWDVRKLIVYTLRMDGSIKSCLYGIKYLTTHEYKRKCDLLLRYGPEFPDKIKQNMYMKLCKNFEQRFKK